jgi:hypothetical protein
MYWKPTLGLVLIGVVIAGGYRFLPAMANQEDTPSAFEAEFQLQREVTVQEPGRTFVVRPRVNYDPRGGYLVADASEKQLRTYSDRGVLVSQVGRPGKGPGEFQHPSAALRLKSSGAIIGVDMTGHLSIFDASGRHHLQTQRTPLVPIYDAAVLNDSLLVLAGRRNGDRDTQLVHVWNLQSGKIVRSFGSVPPHPAELSDAYVFAGSAAVAVRGDTVALAFALGDSIWKFSASQGRRLGAIQIPWQNFRRLSEPMPVADEEFNAWMTTYSANASLFWAEDGTFLVQSLDVNPPSTDAAKSRSRWSAVRLTAGGKRLFEVHDIPRILAVNPEVMEVLHLAVDSEMQNQWAISTFRE